jgi:hypothetical protein
MLVKGKILPQEALMSREETMVVDHNREQVQKQENKGHRGFNKLRVHSVFKDHQARNQNLRLHKIVEQKERSLAEIMLLLVRLVRREVAEQKEDREGYSNMTCFEIKNRPFTGAGLLFI